MSHVKNHYAPRNLLLMYSVNQNIVYFYFALTIIMVFCAPELCIKEFPKVNSME